MERLSARDDRYVRYHRVCGRLIERSECALKTKYVKSFIVRNFQFLSVFWDTTTVEMQESEQTHLSMSCVPCETPSSANEGQSNDKFRKVGPDVRSFRIRIL